MTLDSELIRDAEQFAKKLASTGGFYHDPDKGKQGENLGMRCSSRDYPEYNEVTDQWYAEIKDYNYDTGSKKASCTGRCMIGHFTQVVWKSSTKLGVGKAQGKKNGMFCTWAVARYVPPGNVWGQYQANVKRP